MTAIQAGSRPFSDLAFGLRLALGARRGSWLRLALTAIGTAIGVLVLVIAASVPHVVSRQHEREAAQIESTSKIPGVSPLHSYTTSTTFHGTSVQVNYVSGADRPNTPRAPGIDRMPGPGEVVLSPALKDLLGSSDGALLRPRVAGRAIGTISSDGLRGPANLIAYVGVSGSIPNSDLVYSYGESYGANPMPVVIWLLLVVGVIVLLFPVFVFVVTASRLAGAERDRRLAAMRLIGADARQVRWIAAGESVLGSLVGLLFGGATFLLLRPLVEQQTVAGYSVFSQDVQPSSALILLIVIAVPGLAIGATLFALRHTVIEPLGVMRQGAPPRRRMWWRLVLIAAGGVLLYYGVRDNGSRPSVVQLAAGIGLLLLGIPTLLPWLLQFTVGRAMRGGPAVQLATGRLRQDSGTPARVVAGVAVVLAGAIALFTLISAAQRTYGIPDRSGPPGPVYILIQGSATPKAQSVAATLRTVPGVHDAGVMRSIDVVNTVDGAQSYYAAYVMACPDVRALMHVSSCRDGDTFYSGNQDLRPGETVRVGSADGTELRLPAKMLPMASTDIGADLVFTPAALHGAGATDGDAMVAADFDHSDPNAIERVRNVAAPLRWNGQVTDDIDTTLTTDQKSFRTAKRALYAGSMLTLGMAAATMLVLAIEQIAERRRPLSVLAAAGVPRAMLARSILWQNAIPLVLAMVVADATGLALGALLLRISHERMRLDWTDLGVLTGAAVGAVLLATLLTLPAVRRATRPTMLRAE